MESSKTATIESASSGTSTNPIEIPEGIKNEKPQRPAMCSTASIPAEFEEETLEVHLLDPAPLERNKVCTVIQGMHIFRFMIGQRPPVKRVVI